MRTPNPYSLTAVTSLAVALRVPMVPYRPASTRPASRFGADFVLDFNGVTRREAESSQHTYCCWL